MKAKERKRTPLGSNILIRERENVFLCDDGLEVDLVEGYSIETKRIFFSDIQMITWHLKASTVGRVLGILGLLIAGLITLANASTATRLDITLMLVIMGMPMLVVLLWYSRSFAYVRIFSKRDNASMCWHFRHERSRQIFTDLQTRIRHQHELDQQEAARRIAARAMSLPLPPSFESPAAPIDGSNAAPGALPSTTESPELQGAQELPIAEPSANPSPIPSELSAASAEPRGTDPSPLA